MVAYEYKCTEHGDFTAMSEFGHPAMLAKCPQCGAWGQRIFRPTPVVYKTPGFYSTDTRKASDDTSGN